MRLLVFLAVLCWSLPAWAVKSISYLLVDTAPSVVQGAPFPVVLQITNTGDEVFPVSDLADARITVSHLPPFVWQDTRASLQSDASTIAVSASANVTIGTLVQNTQAAVQAFPFVVTLAAATDRLGVPLYSVAQPASRSLLMAVTAPVPVTGRSLTLLQGLACTPGANGCWVEIGSPWNTTTDGCTGSTGDKTEVLPCTGNGNTIRVSFAEASAIASISEPIWANEGSEAVITSWNAPAYCREAQDMYFWGGGHFAYHGNELYKLALDTLTLTRITEPAPRTVSAPTGHGFPTTGPESNHVYDSMDCVPGAYTQSGNDEIWTRSVGVNSEDDSNRGAIFDTVTDAWAYLGAFNVDVRPSPLAAFLPDTTSSPLTGEYAISAGENLGGVVTYDTRSRTQTLTAGSQNLSPGTMHAWDGAYLIHSATALGTPGFVHNFSRAGAKSASIFTMPAWMNVAGGFEFCRGWWWFTQGTGRVGAWNPFTGETRDFNLPTGTLPTNHTGSVRVYSGWRCLSEIGALLLTWQNPNEPMHLFCPPQGCLSSAVPILGASFEEDVGATTDLLYANAFEYDNDLGSQDFNDDVFRFHSLIGDCGTEICPVIDSGSMLMEVPAGSGANPSGQWASRFGNLSGNTIGDGESLYVSWDQYLPASMLGGFPGSGGFKHIILGEGQNSCSDGEIVLNEYNQTGGPKIYNRCPSGSFGSSVNLFTTEPGNDFDLQPGGDGGICSWNAVNANNFSMVGVPNCVSYTGDKWTHYEIAIDFAAVHGQNSRVRLWMTVEGEARVLVIDVQWPLDFTAPYNVAWFTNFATGKTGGVASFTRYKNLIASAKTVP